MLAMIQQVRKSKEINSLDCFKDLASEIYSSCCLKASTLASRSSSHSIISFKSLILRLDFGSLTSSAKSAMISRDPFLAATWRGVLCSASIPIVGLTLQSEHVKFIFLIFAAILGKWIYLFPRTLAGFFNPTP